MIHDGNLPISVLDKSIFYMNQVSLTYRVKYWFIHLDEVYVEHCAGFKAHAPRFCCGPLDFSDMGPKIVYITTRNPVFGHFFFFIKRPIRAPGLKSKCQTM